MLLSVSNTKVQKNILRTASFSLEAIKTCPFAGDCKTGCFALAGNYVFKNVKAKQQQRLDASKQSDFVDVINAELRRLRVGAVRVHDSGDYYDESYLDKWIKIAESNPSVTFYSYTKSIRFFKSDKFTWRRSLPDNMVITFSYGGLDDALINPSTDKHALVFQSLEQLLEHQYANTSDYDDNAYDKSIIKVGLVAKSYRKKIGWQKTFDRLKDSNGRD